MDYKEFINYIETIAERVTSQLRDALNCLRHHEPTEQKAEILPQLCDLLSALALSDFSANRNPQTSKTSLGSLPHLHTRDGDCTLRFTLIRAFEAKRLGVVLHKIIVDSVCLDILETSDELKAEDLVKQIDGILTDCCRLVGLPCQWFELQ